MSVRIGRQTFRFLQRFVFLSSYRDIENKVDAYGPSWASIQRETATHLIIRFDGYPPDFDVYIHKEDLSNLEYKFQSPGSPIYETMESNRLGFIEAVYQVEGREISFDDGYEEHNGVLYEDHIINGHSELITKFGLTSDIITRLTVYQEWNSPVGKFFVDSRDTDLTKLVTQMQPPTDNDLDISEIVMTKTATYKGSQKQWKVVDVKGDGNCMFRAIANGLHFLRTGQEWGAYNNNQEVLQSELRQSAVKWLCTGDLDVLNMIIPGGQTVEDVIIDTAVSNRFIKAMKRPLDRDSAEAHKEYNKFSKQAITAYCENRSLSNTWGNDLEIFALANVYGVAINVYYAHKETENQSFDKYKVRYVSPYLSSGEINIYLVNYNHYYVMYPQIQ